MATFNSDKIVAGVSKLLPLGYVQSILATAAVPNTLALNDIINMVTLTSDASLTSGDGNSTGGPTILSVALGSDDLDTGTTLTLNVGDAGSAARFISASTIGQTGGRVAATLAPALGYQPFGNPTFATYTTPSLQTYVMRVAVAAAATGATAGNIRLLVEFTIDP